jgi:hypothetical protein
LPAPDEVSDPVVAPALSESDEAVELSDEEVELFDPVLEPAEDEAVEEEPPDVAETYEDALED